jgi:hypothetical protein
MRDLEDAWPTVKDDPEIRGPIALALVYVAMSRAYAEALEKREQKLEQDAAHYASKPMVNVNVGVVFNTVNIQLPDDVGRRWVKAGIAEAEGAAAAARARVSWRGPVRSSSGGRGGSVRTRCRCR